MKRNSAKYEKEPGPVAGPPTAPAAVWGRPTAAIG